MVTYLDENELIRHEEEMTREGQEADDLRHRRAALLVVIAYRFDLLTSSCCYAGLDPIEHINRFRQNLRFELPDRMKALVYPLDQMDEIPVV